MELLDARELRVGGLVDVVVEQELERRLELIDDEPGALAEIGHGRIDDEQQPRLRFLISRWAGRTSGDGGGARTAGAASTRHRAPMAMRVGAWLARAPMTRLLDLLLLAPDLQDAVLALEAVDGAESMAERPVRSVAHAGTWASQRAVWASALRRG